MSDRELLEAAAKAAGVDLHVEWTDAGPTGRYRAGPDGDTWNPLTDDGDALRLAVKLRISVQCRKDHGDYAFADDGGGHIHCVLFGPDGDPYAATRRAIVHAAAEIGRTMP